jgi:3-oxoacyl-(acyl-carrier-protein) synthase
MRPAVWITGLGAVTCLGGSVDELWEKTRTSQTGIVAGLGRVVDPHFAGGNRALKFSVRAAREAMNQAGWSELGPDDGLIFATTTGFFLQWDRAFTSFVAGNLELPEFREKFLNQPLAELNRQLSLELGRPGASTLLTSACSASTQAIGLGAMWIASGRVKRCLIAGVEVLCDLTCEGFRSLQLLSPEPATPFDRERRGINLSEGAAFLCLEAGTRGFARVSGYGFSTDAYHMTGPHPEGEGSFRAMKKALEVSGVGAREVDWVHAHGTGSQQNDFAEGLAVSRLFEEHRPYVSSTKWLHGHALGASGALESVLLVRALSEGVILKTRGLVTPDERIPVRHPEEDLKIRARHVVKSTLGFGGTNAALLYSNGETS